MPKWQTLKLHCFHPFSVFVIFNWTSVNGQKKGPEKIFEKTPICHLNCCNFWTNHAILMTFLRFKNSYIFLFYFMTGSSTSNHSIKENKKLNINTRGHTYKHINQCTSLLGQNYQTKILQWNCLLLIFTCMHDRNVKYKVLLKLLLNMFSTPNVKAFWEIITSWTLGRIVPSDT